MAESNKTVKYAEVQQYIDILSAFPEIERIYLFGSYAYGEPAEHSDIDIAVILSDNVNANKSAYKIEKALASRKTPIDLFTLSSCTSKCINPFIVYK